MKLVPLAIALCAIPAAALAAAPAAQDPLAEARQGKVQCYLGDAARKTCTAISRYDFAADGKIENPALVLVGGEPVTIMAVTSQVEEKGQAVCGIARAADIDKAKLAVAGRQLSPEESQAIKSQIKAAMQQRLDKEICTTYVPEGDQLLAQVTVDGAPAPELSTRVIWVTPGDGYIVAP